VPHLIVLKAGVRALKVDEATPSFTKSERYSMASADAREPGRSFEDPKRVIQFQSGGIPLYIMLM